MTSLLERLPRRTRSRAFNVAVGLFLLVALFWSVFPIYWMLVTAVRPSVELFQRPLQLWPDVITLDNFRNILSGSTPIPRFFVNSLGTSIATVVLTLSVSIPAGFAFSRLRFRLRGPLYVGLLIAQMLPLVVLVLPLYGLFQRVGLLDTYLGLVLAYSAFAVPFGVWLIKSFIDSVPTELEEAALVDGCSMAGALRRVILPVIRPAILATGAFAFLDAWNNLLFPLTLTSSLEFKTLPPGILLAFAGQFKQDWGGMMATSFITALPVVIVFLVFRRHLVDGLTGGATKG